MQRTTGQLTKSRTTSPCTSRLSLLRYWREVFQSFWSCRRYFSEVRIAKESRSRFPRRHRRRWVARYSRISPATSSWHGSINPRRIARHRAGESTQNAFRGMSRRARNILARRVGGSCALTIFEPRPLASNCASSTHTKSTPVQFSQSDSHAAAAVATKFTRHPASTQNLIVQAAHE